MYCELFTILKDDVLLLTANQRLAEYLLRDYNRLQQQKKQAAWQTPAIVPLNTWLVTQWQKSFVTQGVLLSDLEEKLLWQDIIKHDKHTCEILHLNQAVNLAKSAWNTLQLWQLNLQDIDRNTNDEVAAFVSLALQFEKTKTENNFYTKAELPTLVKGLAENHALKLPNKIIFYGFEKLTPAVNSLVAQLRAHTAIEFFECEPQTQQVVRTTCADEEQELIAMATWAKQKLPTLNNREKIGCVIPNLNQKRDSVLRIFTEIFAPNNILPDSPPEPTPYNISVGVTLSHYPMIRCALNILSLDSTHPDPKLLGNILLSPYVNTNFSERALGAMSEAEINMCAAPLTHEAVAAMINTLSEAHFPQCTLGDRWASFCQIKIPSSKQPLSFWVGLIQERLRALGWPGQKPLVSAEYQVMQRWQQCLVDFLKQNHLFSTLTYHKALEIIKELAATLFQPQSEDKPIQILGTLEATGCRFNALWFFGLDDETWPDKANPNPFLPIHLQREHDMPHASAKRELAFAKTTQTYLINSSKQVVMSYSHQKEDRQYRPSRLITQFTEQAFSPSTSLHNTEPTQLENFLDETAPKVEPEENIQGGSFILKQQSLCPFRAFSSIRLGAEPLEQTELGINAREHGTATHHALDSFWKKIGSQQHLTQLTQEEINKVITESVDQALKTLTCHSTHYLTVERQRLITLLTQWCEIEKKRPPFTVVKRESKKYITINQLPMRIQIDRIDELDDGSQLIIDYKTGKSNTVSDWLGTRPRDPQLPIYCLYGSEKSTGLAYAEVNLGSLKYKGLLNHHAGTFSALKTNEALFKQTLSWQTLKQEWKSSLESLANEFVSGNAKVEPQDQTVCTYCHLQSLCRIGECV